MFLVVKKKMCLMVLGIILGITVLGFGGTMAVSSLSNKKIPIYSVERDDTRIALTFNCAWGNEDIDRILQTLEKYNVRATFFVVGTWAEKYPESLEKIFSSGHEIAAHSYNHSHYSKMSYSEILEDLERCDEVIEKVIGSDIYLVRGGYGEYSNAVIDACLNSNRTYIQWSLDSLDYKAQSATEIIERLCSKAENGDIILMHTGTKYTADALEPLLAEMTKNHELVVVSDLIYKTDYTIDHAGRQKSIKTPSSTSSMGDGVFTLTYFLFPEISALPLHFL